MQRLRDDPACADEERDARLDEDDPGLGWRLTFDADADIAAPFIAKGARPRVAILREQGVNSQVEMAAAFDRAGFAPVDVHMTDLIDAGATLEGFQGLVACGGFSYGDVLGAGEGWAKSILFNPRARSLFEAWFARPDRFTLGVCNGCQMLAALAGTDPGQRRTGRASQEPLRAVRRPPLDGRDRPVELALPCGHGGVASCRSPSPTARPGRVHRAMRTKRPRARSLRCASSIDNRGQVATRYPSNPNGSPQGAAGYASLDGRVTILMPHRSAYSARCRIPGTRRMPAETAAGCGCSGTPGYWVG